MSKKPAPFKRGDIIILKPDSVSIGPSWAQTPRMVESCKRDRFYGSGFSIDVAPKHCKCCGHTEPAQRGWDADWFVLAHPALGIGAKPTKEAVRRTGAKRSGAKPGRSRAKATPKKK